MAQARISIDAGSLGVSLTVAEASEPVWRVTGTVRGAQLSLPVTEALAMLEPERAATVLRMISALQKQPVCC